MPAQDVTISAYVDVTPEDTVEASETKDPLIDAQSVKHPRDTYTFTFSDNLLTTHLAGKELYLLDARPADGSGLTLATTSDMAAYQKTAGHAYGNANFAFLLGMTGTPENAGNYVSGKEAADLSVQNAQPVYMGTIAENSTLTFDLFNVNALTYPGVVGAYEFEFATCMPGETYDTEADCDTLVITLEVSVKPARLQATVPLVMVVKTNIDGGSTTLKDGDDKDTYFITNESSTRLDLTHVKEEDKSNTLDPYTGNGTSLDGEFDKYRISYDDRVTAKTGTTDGELSSAVHIESTETFAPIEKIEVSQVSFVTEKAREGVEHGEHIATLTYTVEIPKTGAEADKTN